MNKSLLDLTFYHGSEIPINGSKIKANAVNIGNRLEKPSWSVYMWRNKEFAYTWALYRRILVELKNAGISRKDEPQALLDIHAEGFKIAITPKIYGTIRDITIGKKTYVYTIKSDIRNVGLGHSESLPEFTSTEDCTITGRETVLIDEDFFERKTYLATKEMMDRLMHVFGRDKKHRVFDLSEDLETRGLPTLIMYGDNYVFPINKRVNRKLKDGLIKVGDDMSIIVDDILKEMNVLKESSLDTSDENLTMYEITKDNYRDFQSIVDFEKYEIDESNYKKGTVYLLLDRNKNFVATVCIMPYKEDNLKWLVNLFVSEKYRKKGLGQQLVDMVLEKGADALAVNVDNKVAINLYEKNGFKTVVRNGDMYVMLHKSAKPSESFKKSVREIKSPFYFYHMVPKTANMRKGLLSPYAMYHAGMEVEALNALNKYRNRLCDGWDIYPDRTPESLTLDELVAGVNKFRGGDDGCKTIYFFKYPPTKKLGPKMAAILKEKDIYRIDLNDEETKKYITNITWGWIGSNTDNSPVNREWYENITPEEYFASYKDNPKDGTPLFAPLVHIGVAFKDGICPRKCLTKIKPNSLESVREEVETVSEATKSDPNMYLTKTKLDLNCEVKNSYHTLKGETRTPIPQLILHKNGKNYRVRSEILVFKDGKVLLEKKEKETHYGTMYVIPGGGIDDPKELIEKAAARECNEEARIVVSDVRFSGMTKSALYGEKVPDWHKKTLWLDGIKYDGYFSYICTGIYAKDYKGYVKVVDRQADVENKSHWYSYDEVKDILTPEHKKLFEEYLETIGQSVEEASVLTEASKKPSKENFKDFKDFCKAYETPEEVLEFLRKKKAHWPTKEEMKKRKFGEEKRPNQKPFTWPEEMIFADSPVAICFDYAVFFHFYFKERHVENHVVAMGWFDDDKKVMLTGHAICAFKRDSKWFLADYHEEKKGIRTHMQMIIGPSNNLENLVEAYVVSMKLVLQKIFPKVKRITHYYLIQTEEEMKRYYEDERGSIQAQEQIVMKDMNRFLRPAMSTVLKNMGYPSWMILPFIPLWTYFDVKDKVKELFEDVKVRPDIIEQFETIAESTKLSIAEATEKQPEVPETTEEVPLKKSASDSIVEKVMDVLGDKVDQKEFAKLKSGKKFMYTRCRVMQKYIPLVIFLSYCEGLTTVMRKAGVEFQFSDTRPRLEPIEQTRKGIIQFADGYLIYKKYPLKISLLMNGLSVMDTKSVEYADMDTKDVYANLFDTLFGMRMLANALDNFYDLMIDSVTKEILDDMNYPTDLVNLMLVGNELLADNNYIHELDMKNWRIRNNEQVYAHAYRTIADAYSKYRSTAANKNPAKISIPQDAVVKSIMTSQIVEDVSELSPLLEMKKAHLVTDKGPSGTNLEESYTMERRCYHPSMMGVIAMTTSPDGNVGVQRNLTLEPNVVNGRGYVLPEGDRQESECNLFDAEELMSPGGATRDDPIRSAMSSKQSGHLVPVESSSPVLMSNGAEKVLPYHLSNDFTVVAKDDGEVVEKDEKSGVIVLKYKNLKGEDQIQVINMNPKVVKNGAGGFFLPNQLNCDKLKKGMKFKKNDVLAYTTRFFSNSKEQGVRFNIGTLTKLACIASYANYEDADLITDKLSRKLGTDICMEATAVVGKNANVDFMVKKGQRIEVNDPLIIYDQSSQDASFNKMLSHIGKELKEEITGMGKVPVKSKYSGVIQDIKVYATVDTKEMSPSLRKAVEGVYSEIRAQEKIIKRYAKEGVTNGFAFTERAEKIEPTQDGKVMGIKVGEGVLFRFFIKYHDRMAIGDKLVHFAAVKCVNGEMIPKGQEPYSLNNPDEEISSTFAPAAILARMVPSLFSTMYGNKVVVELKRAWLNLYKKDNPKFEPKDELY